MQNVAHPLTLNPPTINLRQSDNCIPRKVFQVRLQFKNYDFFFSSCFYGAYYSKPNKQKSTVCDCLNDVVLARWQQATSRCSYLN